MGTHTKIFQTNWLLPKVSGCNSLTSTLKYILRQLTTALQTTCVVFIIYCLYWLIISLFSFDEGIKK